MIPKIILQTSVKKLDSYIKDFFQHFAPGYKYEHYTDNEILNYFNSNPIKEFPNVSKLFNSYVVGAHKSDLFRYYYLYLNGGVFVDSDAMLRVNIENIIKSYDAVFIESCLRNNSFFNGFIAITKGNPIMYEALKTMYNVSISRMNQKNNYFQNCKDLKRIVMNKKNPKIKVLNEKMRKGFADTFYEKDIVLTHYFRSKRVPENLLQQNKSKANVENTKNKPKENKVSLQSKDEIIKSKIPQLILQISKNPLPQYVLNFIKQIAPGWKYKRFSCGHKSDDEVCELFKKHPMKEFPNIEKVYYSFKNGAHKADLIRYFYLYHYGGVYIDSDAMLNKNVNCLIKNYNSVFVLDIGHRGIFNGVIGTTPKNPIIYNALKEVLNTPQSKLERNYYYFCIDLLQKYNKYKSKDDFLYQEFPYRSPNNGKGGMVYDCQSGTRHHTGDCLAIHYHSKKIIPTNHPIN